MYKLIRLFAPVILVLYVSTMIVGSCWGEEGKDQNLIFLSANQPNDYAMNVGFGYEWNFDRYRIGADLFSLGQRRNGDHLNVYGLYMKLINNDDSYCTFGVGGATYYNEEFKRIVASGAVTGFIEADDYRGSLYLSASLGHNMQIFNQLFAGEIEGLILNQESLLLIRIKYLFPDSIFRSLGSFVLNR